MSKGFGEPWSYVWVEVGYFRGPTCAIQDPDVTYHDEYPGDEHWSYRHLIDSHDNDIEISQQEELTDAGKRAIVCVNTLAGIDNPAAQVERWKEIERAAEGMIEPSEKAISELGYAIGGDYRPGANLDSIEDSIWVANGFDKLYDVTLKEIREAK